MDPEIVRCYELGAFRLNVTGRELLRAGTPIALTPKSFDLLVVLAENAGRVVSKEELMRRVWQGTFVEEGNLAVTVFALRKAMGDSDNARPMIETVPRRGYRLTVQVKAAPVDSASQASEFRSLAVLPFRSLSPVPENDKGLGLGMADALITRLSNVRQFTVSPTSEILRFASAEVEPVEAGRQLRVDAVIVGHVQRAVEMLRITVQLVRAADGRALWAGKFDEKFTGIFDVQDSIAGQVARALTNSISDEERARMVRRHTESSEAYQHFMRGWYHFHNGDRDSIYKAIEAFEKALAADADYALAYAGLAECYAWLSYFFVAPKDAMPRARHHARIALGLDETLAEAHVIMAEILKWFDWNFAGAEKHYKRAMELDPSYYRAHLWYGFYLAAMGRFDEAVEEVDIGVRLTATPHAYTAAAYVYYYARRYEEALRDALCTVEVQCAMWTAHLMIQWVYEQQGRFAEAIESGQRAIETSGRSPMCIAALGHTYALAGQTEKAREILDELNRSAAETFVLPYYVALIHAVLGEPDAAFACLERSFTERLSHTVWMGVDPKMDPLRSDPRFTVLLKRVGLPE